MLKRNKLKDRHTQIIRKVSFIWILCFGILMFPSNSYADTFEVNKYTTLDEIMDAINNPNISTIDINEDTSITEDIVLSHDLTIFSKANVFYNNESGEAIHYGPGTFTLTMDGETGHKRYISSFNFLVEKYQNFRGQEYVGVPYNIPTITGEDLIINQHETLDSMEGIVATYTDGSDATADVMIQNDASNVDPSIPGTYEVRYRIEESMMLPVLINGTFVNQSFSVPRVLKRTITVLPKNNPPTIEAKNQTINLGSVVDLLNYAKANDLEDGAIEVSILKDGGFDANKIGVYNITYSAKDSQGIETTKTIQITVRAFSSNIGQNAEKEVSPNTGQNKNANISLYLLIGSMVVVLGSLVLKRKKASW